MIEPTSNVSWPAEEYAASRPKYPDQLFEFLDSRCRFHHLAWDCATGNGQAAVPLARRFRSVLATDTNASQLSQATANPGVNYVVAQAERSPLANATVDLITVAQALHWFGRTSFFTEVGRVLKPGGLFAAWHYFLPNVSPEVDSIVHRLYYVVLDDYWPRQVRLVEEGYRTIPFPFVEVAAATFDMVDQWDLFRFVRYLGTWAAAPSYKSQMGREPVAELTQELEDAWGDSNQLREVRWTVTLRSGRNA